MKRISSSYRLLDYNDKAAFDCVVYDEGRDDFVNVELEPTLIEFLQHKRIPDDLETIVTWTLGKWRVGARKRGTHSYLQLVAENGAKPGHYKLLAFARTSSRSPSASYAVIALDQVLRK